MKKVIYSPHPDDFKYQKMTKEEIEDAESFIKKMKNKIEKVNSKIYAIYRSRGSHDDYVQWVDRGYKNQNEAQEYIDKKNLQIKRCKELANSLWENDANGSEYGKDYEQENWVRYNKLLELGNFWVGEIEVF